MNRESDGAKPLRGAAHSVGSSAAIVIRFSSLGDLALCSAFVEALKAKYPQQNVVFISAEAFGDFLSTFKVPPDRIEAWATRPHWLVKKSFRLVNELKRAGCTNLDVYDLHGVSKSWIVRASLRLACLFLGLRCKIRQSPKHSFLRWLSVFFHRDFLGIRYVYREHLSLLGNTLPFRPQLRVSAHNGTLISAPKSSRVLFAPDAQHWKKRWPLNYWEELIEKVLQNHPSTEITLVGGKNIFPQDMIDSLSEKGGAKLKNHLGTLPLGDLAKLAAEHTATVCGNSAWQHISEAVGIPVISLSGPIIRGFGFAPWLNSSIELSVELPCRPCTRHGEGLCPYKGERYHACMRRISSDDVYANLRKFLA